MRYVKIDRIVENSTHLVTLDVVWGQVILTPAQARTLATSLQVATLPPRRCVGRDDYDLDARCTNYAQSGSDHCADHLARADDEKAGM